MKPESVRFSDLMVGRLFKAISELGSHFVCEGGGEWKGGQREVAVSLYFGLVFNYLKKNFKYVWGGGEGMCLDMDIETRGQFEGALLPCCEF